MIDLLQATEFIKMPNGKYLNKFSNGKEYSETELKELLKTNNKEVTKKKKVKKNEIKSETEQID
jgi:hypothetical protein